MSYPSNSAGCTIDCKNGETTPFEDDYHKYHTSRTKLVIRKPTLYGKNSEGERKKKTFLPTNLQKNNPEFV